MANLLVVVVNWSTYNKSWISRGKILFSYDFLEMPDDKFNEMNENKKCKPYAYLDSFMGILITLECIFLFTHYIQTERE